jgi:acetyl esterase/lipase
MGDNADMQFVLNSAIKSLYYPIVGHREGRLLDLWLPSHAPAEWKGLIVYAHGGGFSHGKRRDGFAPSLAGRLVPEGYAVASIDYRRQNNPASDWNEHRLALIASEQVRSAKVGLTVKPQYCGPWFYAALEDFSDAIAFLKSPSCGVDFTGLPVLALGASAGGIAALSLAFRPKGWNHLTLPDAACGISAAMVQPWRMGAEPRTPALMIHGARDRVIDVENARFASRKAEEKGAPLRVVVVDQIGHKELLSHFLNGIAKDGRPWWRLALDLIGDPHGKAC